MSGKSWLQVGKEAASKASEAFDNKDLRAERAQQIFVPPQPVYESASAPIQKIDPAELARRQAEVSKRYQMIEEERLRREAAASSPDQSTQGYQQFRK